MKKLLFTSLLVTVLGSYFGHAQSVVSPQNVLPQAPLTSPTNISQLEVRGNRLITQNFQPSPAGLQITGLFGATARWNSMGNLTPAPGSTAILAGFRTQTDGRGLAMGYSTSLVVPTSNTLNSSLSDPFIEWIGNAAVSPTLTPGTLRFRYAINPTGGSSVPIFTMRPSTNAAIPSFNYAERNALLGQLQNGLLGSFTTSDIWSATGLITTPNFLTYGTRQQYNGHTLNSGLITNISTSRTDAVIDFGNNSISQVFTLPTVFKFRSFVDPTDLNSVKNIWQSGNLLSNIVLGRQDYNLVNSSPFYLSLFNGQASNTSSQALSIGKAGIYATTDGKDEFGNDLQSYASIIGEIENPGSDFGQRRFAIAGLTNGNSNGNIYAGYFVGDVSVSGTLFQGSDRKLKKQIKDEEGILKKVMQLQPKNYLFDIEKFPSMGFSNKLQHGLISQDVELIFPELVQNIPMLGDEKNSTYKALNYMGLITLLTKSIQELNTKVDELETKLASNNSRANTLVLKEAAISNSEKLLLENKSFSLSQNIPNPFTESTTINYTIPQNVSKALLAIFDLNGKMLLQYNLQQGNNQVKINGNQLTAGMYIYSLIADGAEVVSNRMILTK